MDRQELIDQMCLAWEDAFASKTELSPVEICQRHGCPELASELAGAIDLLRRFPSPACAAPAFAHADFERVEFHAQGGLGTVYRAVEKAVGRTVALKRIRADSAASSTARARFLHEGTVTAKLEHPGIIPVYRVYQSDTQEPFNVMRFIEGVNLQSAIDLVHATSQKPANQAWPSLAPTALAERKEQNLRFRQAFLNGKSLQNDPISAEEQHRAFRRFFFNYDNPAASPTKSRPPCAI